MDRTPQSSKVSRDRHRDSLALILADADELLAALATPGYSQQPAGIHTIDSANSLSSAEGGAPRRRGSSRGVQPQRLRLGSYNSEQSSRSGTPVGSPDADKPPGANQSDDVPRDTLHGLLNEANDIITLRDAEKAGTMTSRSTSIFQGWVECRGKSKRFYSWKRRFVVWDSDSRKLSIFSDESLDSEKASYIVTDCNIHFRADGKKFWQRELRIDLAVTDSERSPLCLNLFTKEAQTSWLRLFKRKGDHLDVTVDESTRVNEVNRFMEENKETKTKNTTKSEDKQQIRTLTRAVKAEERVRRAERPEWSKFLSTSHAHLSPLTVEETMKLFASADSHIASMVDSRKQHELNTFVSSCERDFLLERALLNADVYPFLREVGKSFGITVNLPVDLSFAPPHFKNTHAIESVRNAEIHHCRSSSVGVAYVQLFGDRYGPNVLPTLIPASAFDKIMCVMEDAGHLDEVVLFTKWYHLDENSVPSVYKLQPINSLIKDYLSSNKQKQQWAEMEWAETVEKLEQSLSFASEGHMEENWRETYQTSELHSEFKQGVLQLPGDETTKKCLAFVRDFTNLDFNHVLSLNYADVREETTLSPETGARVHLSYSCDDVRKSRLDNLKSRLVSTCRVKKFRYSVEDPTQILNSVDSEGDDGYLQNFLDVFCTEMVASLEKAADIKERDPTPLEADVAAHVAIAMTHQDYYYPSQYSTLIQESVLRYLDDKSITSPFYVHGPIGSGKTFLISHLLKEILDLKTDDSVAIIRFVGSGHSTSTGIELMSSLCEQMISIIGTIDATYEPRELPHTFEDMAHTFPKILKLFAERRKNLIIFLDGLDTLSSKDVSEPALLFSWLPTILPRGVKIVYTGDSKAGSHAALASLSQGNDVKIDKWGWADVEGFIDSKLEKRGRKITLDQRDYVQKCVGDFSTPLTAQLIMHEVASWPSYLDTVDRVQLRNSSTWLVDKMLEKIEKKHGEILVRVIFGYLYCAMERGLTSNELLDVLSLDDSLLAMLEKLLPPESLKLQRRFPTVIWARVRQDTRDILRTASTADGTVVWTFAHDAIREAAGRRCQKMHKNLHLNLADYFGGVYAEGKAIRGGSRIVPRFIDAQELMDMRGKPNLRKIMEYPYHLVECKQWDKLGEFLSDLRVLDVLGNRGSRRSLLRPGTARTMLLELWDIWAKEVGGDMSAVYLKSLGDWMKETTPSVRDSNRRMKSVAVFLLDVGKESENKKYIKNAADLLRQLLGREISEFGDDHPASMSTLRMLTDCERLLQGRKSHARKGSVGLNFQGTPVKMMNPGGAESTLQSFTPLALEKRITEESPIPISPIANDGEEQVGGVNVTSTSWVASKQDQYKDIVQLESELSGNILEQETGSELTMRSGERTDEKDT